MVDLHSAGPVTIYAQWHTVVSCSTASSAGSKGLLDLCVTANIGLTCTILPRHTTAAASPPPTASPPAAAEAVAAAAAGVPEDQMPTVNSVNVSISEASVLGS